ncbi:MAG: PDZ domain-containing protein [Planctomycetota bacterium]
MSRTILTVSLVALAALVGCSRRDEQGDLAERLEALEARNRQLRQRLDRLTEDLEPLAERVQQVHDDHRRITRTLSQVQQDLQDRLNEMVAQQMGAGPQDLRRREPAIVAAAPPKPRPYLGFDAATLTAEIAKRLKLAVQHGVLVTGVRDGAPAAAAGLRKDDVVVKVDGTDVPTKAALAKVVLAKKPGDAVTLALLRGGEPVELKITLGRR